MANVKRYKKRWRGLVLKNPDSPRDDNGRIVYKHIYADTKEECERKIFEYELAIKNGLNPNVKYTFQELSDLWLNTKIDIAPNTKTQYSVMLRDINRILGQKKINMIRVAHFKELMNYFLMNNKQNESYLKKVKVICKGVMEYAVENGLLGYNPFSSAKLPNKTIMKNGTRDAISEDQQKALLDHWRVHRIGIGALIMFYCGLRRGELLALKWSDIHLDKGFMRVSRSVWFDGNKPIVKDGGKTENAERELQIHPDLLKALKEWRRNPESLQSEYICFTSTGKHKGDVMTQSAFDRAWERFMIKINIACGGVQADKRKGQEEIIKLTPFTPHQLRHTCTTNLFLADIDPKSAQYYMGHADLSTTLEIYTHIDKEIVGNRMKRFFETDFNNLPESKKVVSMVD